MFEVLASIGRIILLSVATASLASALFLAVRILWEYLKYYLAKKYSLRLGRKPETANPFAVGDLVVYSRYPSLVYVVSGVSGDYILIDHHGQRMWEQRHLYQPYAAETANLESLGQEYDEILGCQQAWESVHGTHDRS